MKNLTPQQIVEELDRYIVGQAAAKRAVAVALRNRYRRLQLAPEVRAEITPKNILMIGPTGVGKTEIARRLAKLADAPFVKVEATKFTEVGYVGRDAESIVRDLMDASINMVHGEKQALVQAQAEEMAHQRILNYLLAPKQPEEFWSFNYPNPRVPAGGAACITAREPFLLHWSVDEWHTVYDTQAAATPLGLYVARINVPAGTSGRLRFTFHWTAPDRWEGRDFAMAIAAVVSPQ